MWIILFVALAASLYYASARLALPQNLEQLSAWILAIYLGITWARQPRRKAQLGKFAKFLVPVICCQGLWLLPYYLGLEALWMRFLYLLALIGLPGLLWIAGLYTLSLPRPGVWIRRLLWPIGLVVIALLSAIWIPGDEVMGSWILSACFLTIAYFTLHLLLLADEGYPAIQKQMRRPVIYLLTFGLYALLMFWAHQEEKDYRNESMVVYLGWMLLVMAAVRWMWRRPQVQVGMVSFRSIGTTLGLMSFSLATYQMFFTIDMVDYTSVYYIEAEVFFFGAVALFCWSGLSTRMKYLRIALQITYSYLLLVWVLPFVGFRLFLPWHPSLTVAVAALATILFVQRASSQESKDSRVA